MKVYAVSNTGLVRPTNQDAFYVPRAGEAFAAVADGMGGHRAGEVASAMAIDTFARRMRSHAQLSTQPERALRDALDCANLAIFQTSEREADKRGMGTTFTGLLMCDGEAHLAHIGDSRAYLLRDGRLRKMSKDHTLVAELVARGSITPEQAKVHPHRNYITRSLGVESEAHPDVSVFEWLEDDVWFLCSDGMTNEVEEEDIERVLSNGDYERALAELIDMALDNGGRDNVTGLVLTTEEDSE